MNHVRVSISTGIDNMDIERPYLSLMADGPGVRFHDAASILRQIADDIDRMYPKGQQ